MARNHKAKWLSFFLSCLSFSVKDIVNALCDVCPPFNAERNLKKMFGILLGTRVN